jgi:hypothetical protein
MATTSLYLIPRPPAIPATPTIPATDTEPEIPGTPGVPLDGNTVGKFSSVAPPDGTIIFTRQYGPANDIETVIALLQGMRAELNAMTGLPVAIRLDLIAP